MPDVRNLPPLIALSKMLQSFRQTLWERGFIELPTALIHEHDACPIFQRVRLEDGRYLKESGGLALRCNLAHAPKIFEVAQCARKDSIDPSHLQQFTMLDLYDAEATIANAISLCKELVTSVYHGPVKTCSVAAHIQETIGVDLFNDPECEANLKTSLARRYDNPNATLFSLVNSYMTREIEPLSKNCLVIVTDVPRAAESAGRQKPGSFGVANIAEIQIDCMEVAQIIEDEPDTESYLERAKLHGHYGPEVELVVDEIRQGRIPSQSAGFGIGLERLAMVATGRHDIQAFMPSRNFIREL